ncbi:MAG TPA: ABC transporter permease [Ktedonobacteraceae bacterium]|nr:ABC transporter permease [Ktedonobacteraceae bacterium]
MWQHVFLSLNRRRSQSLLASCGFLLAACALILLSATTQTTALYANQIINQNWQPTYDLVVLPSTAHPPQGTNIPADTLEGYNGGISLQQYAQVQATPGVEVAAPIAFIGYGQLPSPSLQFTSTPLPPDYYRIDWTLAAFNGQRQIVERQVSYIFNMASSCDVASDPAMQSLRQQHVLLGGCGPDIGSKASNFQFPSIDTGTFLLAAIDPTAEDQLLHLDRSIVSGRMLQPQEGLKHVVLTYAGPADEVPLLFHQNLASGQITLHATFSRVTSRQLPPQQVLQAGGFSYLAQLPGQQVLLSQDVPVVQDDPQRFSDTTLIWNGRSWQPVGSSDVKASGSGSGMRFLYTPSGLTYRQITGPNGKPAYALVPGNTQSAKSVLSTLPAFLPGDPDNPDDQQGPEVYFRSLQPLLTRNMNAGYLANPVGEFNASAVNSQFSNQLNWLPETTYASPPVVLRYDAQGQPVNPTTLLPTTNPAGMLIQPPLALTTLRAATQLTGNDRLISVIRVRVSGVTAPNDASWKRVEQVAQLIERRTGLRALVTLGSSPAPTLVYVPGLHPGQNGSTRTIAPLGWVEERWIALGVSLLYLGQVGQMQLVLLSALLLVCLGYLIVTLSSLLTTQRRDLAILSALGWRPWQPTRLFLTQALLLALGGGLGGMGMALLVIHLIGADPPWPIVALTLPVVLCLALLSSLTPLWRIWHMRPAELLRTGMIAETRTNDAATRRSAALTSLTAMALLNLQRMRARSLVALVSLFLSAALLVVMLDSLLAFQQALQGTLLGSYILLQTAVPQLAGALFALVLTFPSVSDLLLLHLRERYREIGLLLATGWRIIHVQRLFVQEGLTLALLGTIPGALAAAALLFSQHGAHSIGALILVGLCTILLMTLIASLAAIPALRLITRMQLIEIMRAE